MFAVIATGGKQYRVQEGSVLRIQRLAAEQGAKVVISSRKADACEATAAEINAKFGEGTALPVRANISSKEELEILVAETRRAFGKITTLVCNAASNPYYGPGLGISDEQFRKIMDNNILSNHWLISMVAPEMVERGEGAITIISSIGGLKGSPIIGAYGISKAADMQVARNFSVEFGPRGVRVNCIAPGLVRTDMARALWENEENLRRSTAASCIWRRRTSPPAGLDMRRAGATSASGGSCRAPWFLT